MPRVNRVEKCRKSPGVCGKCGENIPVGAPYLFWAFMVGGRGGPKKIRCGKPECRPRRWDLTQSEYYSTLYRIQDTAIDGQSMDDLESVRDDIQSQLEELQGDTQDKLDNMPEGLQQGDSGCLLQERIDSLDSAINELQNIDFEEPDYPEDADDEKKKELLQQQIDNVKEEIDSALSSVE